MRLTQAGQLVSCLRRCHCLDPAAVAAPVIEAIQMPSHDAALVGWPLSPRGRYGSPCT